MFWSCPSLCNYWSVVFRTISLALNLNLQPNAYSVIFVTVPSEIQTIKKHIDIIAFTTLLAHRRILMHWKSSTPPITSLWMSDLILYLKLERMKYTLKGSKDCFYSPWNPVMSYLGTLKSLPDN